MRVGEGAAVNLPSPRAVAAHERLVSTGVLLKLTQQRVAAVLNLHTRAPRRHGRRLCVECGMPYPCETRRILLGQRLGDDERAPARRG